MDMEYEERTYIIWFSRKIREKTVQAEDPSSGMSGHVVVLQLT